VSLNTMRLTREIKTRQSTTSARATGARTTATATSANRIAGGDSKSGTRASINIFNTNSATSIQKTFLNEEFQTTVFKNFIIAFWLIQSQPQRGTSSATLHQGYTQSRINTILLQVFSKFFYCLVSNGKFRHSTPPIIYG